MLKVHHAPTFLWNVDDDYNLIGYDHQTEPMVPAFDGDQNDSLTSYRDGPAYTERVKVTACTDFPPNGNS